MIHSPTNKSIYSMVKGYFFILLGAFLAALSIRVFIFPNQLIDGGVVGVALILGRLLGEQWISLFILLLNIPFIYLAYKHIRKNFVVQMMVAVLLFALFMVVLEFAPPFIGDPLEIIVLGGTMLGAGVGLIIRYGGCLDGSEILGIIANRRYGFTVGQVVLFINFFVFGAYGWIFLDWHIALKSLFTYVVAYKTMDMVIVGLDELKSLLIHTNIPDRLAKAITTELGVGLTILQGKGGYTGAERQVLMVVIERLDLADLKELVLREDPNAFIAIQNLHEVVWGSGTRTSRKRK